MTPSHTATLQTILHVSLDELGNEPAAVLRRLTTYAQSGMTVTVAGLVEPDDWPAMRRLLIAVARLTDAHRARQIHRGMAARAVAGRPRIVDAERVRALRQSGMSWARVAAECGCSVRTVRRAALRTSTCPEVGQ